MSHRCFAQFVCEQAVQHNAVYTTTININTIDWNWNH